MLTKKDDILSQISGKTASLGRPSRKEQETRFGVTRKSKTL